MGNPSAKLTHIPQLAQRRHPVTLGEKEPSHGDCTMLRRMSDCFRLKISVRTCDTWNIALVSAAHGGTS